MAPRTTGTQADAQPPSAWLQTDHNMSEQRQKRQHSLSALFRALRSRPVQARVCAGALPSSSASMSTRMATTLESVAGSSRILPPNDDSQTVDESANQRPDQNTSNLQRVGPMANAMFSDIERVHIGVGNFNQNIYNINNRDDNVLQHLTFQSLPRSRDAAFSAAINHDNLARRACTKDTRVDITANIMAWVKEKDPAKAPPVYWLTGLAGLGKTTIAYTICEWLNDASLPFASFFCSLQLDSRDSKLLVPTLCRDLAEQYDSYAAHLLSILQTNSKAADAVLRSQINELLVKPWQASIAQRKDYDVPIPVVVVDALDESNHGTEFLKELLRVVHGGKLVGIKFLVTSRPDPKIGIICKSFPPNAVCKLHEVDTTDVQKDIEKYLQEALPELKDEPELASLSHQAGGFFIYATTAVRFISPPNSPPSVSEMCSHLRAMLNPDPLASYADSGGRLLVDELYERILSEAFQDLRVLVPRLQILHTVVCAESKMNMSVLAELTNTNLDTVKIVVESLHAVLFVSSEDGYVYWYHASFPDFLFSKTRARIIINSLRNDPAHRVIDVSCDAVAQHGVVALRCFSIMEESLHFNMCNLPSSYVFDSEVLGLEDSIEKKFTPTLRYVLRHWARHLVQAMPAENDTDDLFRGLKDFLCNKLLFWIEAMNLIGAKSECSSLLEDAESWLEKGKEWPEFLRQLTGATKFSAFFAGSPASKSTPHLYISALCMWNADSPIWRIWRDRFGFIPSISKPIGGIALPLLTIRTTTWVSCIASSSDGSRIVSGSLDKSVRVWNSKTGEQLCELQGHTNSGRPEWIVSVAFSPDGSQIVSGSYYNLQWLWDRDRLGKRQGCTVSEDNSVRVWDANTGEQLMELQGHTGPVTSVAFSSDGNQIVSGSLDNSVHVWDVKTGKQLRELQGHADIVTSVAFESDGNRIVSGSYDKSVRVWDTKISELPMELKGHTDWVASVAFSSNGSRIVSSSYDKSVRVWDAKTGAQLMELQGHSLMVSSVAFSSDGNRIVSGCYDTSVRVWDVNTGALLMELQGHTGVISSVTFSSDDNRIISGSYDKSVRVWDSMTGELRELHYKSVSSVVFSSDGNQIVSVSKDKSVRLWDAKTGEQIKELQGHTDSVTSAAFSSDGNRIVSGSRDRSVRLWDAKTGEQLKELQGHTALVSSVTFSCGNQIVSGSYDKLVRVWDADTGELLRELKGHTDFVTSVASYDGNRIVSGSHDGSVRVWEANTGKLLMELEGHSNWVTSVAFSSDGNRIVSGSDDRSVRVWDANTGRLLRELRADDENMGMWSRARGPQSNTRVNTVAFSSEGNRIASGHDDNSVRVWDANTGEQLGELQGHTDSVTSVAFSLDGNRIVSGSYDKSVRVWSLNLDASWVVNEDGWILSGGERLVWVPSTVCNVLLRPQNTLLISPNGYATISFAQCKFGTFWHECYTS